MNQVVAELERLNKLRADGAINDGEYQTLKARLLPQAILEKDKGLPIVWLTTIAATLLVGSILVLQHNGALTVPSNSAPAPMASRAAPPALVPAATGPSPVLAAGNYHRSAPANADMKVSPSNGKWRFDVEGSAVAPTAEATPADCHIVAVGTSDKAGKIVADFVPFSDDNTDVGPDDVKDHHLLAHLTSEGIVVDEADVFAICGQYSDLSGTFQRNR